MANDNQKTFDELMKENFSDEPFERWGPNNNLAPEEESALVFNNDSPSHFVASPA